MHDIEKKEMNYEKGNLLKWETGEDSEKQVKWQIGTYATDPTLDRFFQNSISSANFYKN